MVGLVEDEAEKGEHPRRAEEIATTLYDTQHQMRSVSAEDFAGTVEAALAKADEADLDIETKIRARC